MSYEQPPGAEAVPADDVDPPPPDVPAGGTSYDQPPQDPPRPPAMPPYGGSHSVLVVSSRPGAGAAAASRAVRLLGWTVAATVLVPVVGGVVAGIASSARDSSPDLPSFSAPDPVVGSAERPLTVTEGAPFALGGVRYRAGWQVASGTFGKASISGLRGRNLETEPISPVVRFQLEKGGTALATITCAIAGIEPGTAQDLICVSQDELPQGYGLVTVSTLL